MQCQVLESFLPSSSFHARFETHRTAAVCNLGEAWFYNKELLLISFTNISALHASISKRQMLDTLPNNL